ncbi:MAG: zinc-ribbon domain-containing protein, partial [Planctomycetes bacterium]|nr:zinc-ribbon domain-containing protein [Planctomycetota bacterium]
MRATAIALALCIVSASTGATPDYAPLQEGNQWTFRMSNGAQSTMKVTGFADVGAVRCAILETTSSGQTSREYLAVDTEGVKTYVSQAQGQEFRYDPPLLRIKLPYKEGDAWTATATQGRKTVTTSFQSIGKERIQTPAGIFDCIKIYSTVDGVPGASISYYADGIGPVRQVMRAGRQETIATLTSINIKPTSRTRTASKPQPVAKIRCPKCGTEVDTKAQSCPRCGQKVGAPVAAPEPNRPAAPHPARTSSLEKYQSPDGKALLFKPPDWNVAQGDLFGPDTYGVMVLEPQENAVVLFITFPVGEEVKDSVMLAARCITALHQRYPDLQAVNVSSTPQRERTLADLTLTAEGEKGFGHGYFFHAQGTGSVYILLAKARLWNELRPTLTTIAANLAYAPQGMAAVQDQGQPATGPASAEGSVHPLAAMLIRAAQQTGKPLPLQPAALADQSLSLQIPEGWALEGARVQYATINDSRIRTHGVGSLWLTITPAAVSVPGAINVPYQPPPQALKIALESGRSTRDVQVIAECPVEQAVPALTQTIQQMRAQGAQVDARLIHVRFRNVPTENTCRGLFCVMCSIKPDSPVWHVSLQGSWAPDQEYEEWFELCGGGPRRLGPEREGLKLAFELGHRLLGH